MQSVRSMMTDRESEINQYFDMLDFLDKNSTNGYPTLNSKNNTFSIDAIHLHIMVANAYLLLYNYIEAIITQSLSTLSEHIKNQSQPITAFKEPIQKEWLTNGLLLNDAKTSIETRLSYGLKLLEQLHTNTMHISVSKGGGGGFNNEEIVKLAKKLGIDMTVTSNMTKRLTNVNSRKYRHQGRNKDTCMKEITRERNRLAHGEITFGECGKNCSIPDLIVIKQVTFDYLELFVNSMQTYINKKEFLIPPTP